MSGQGLIRARGRLGKASLPFVKFRVFRGYSFLAEPALTSRLFGGMFPPMKLIADQKRRVVLPKSVKPGDALELLATGDRIILQILRPPTAHVPPVSAQRLNPAALSKVDLDEPAFTPMSDESPA
jgi:hypothetical protein